LASCSKCDLNFNVIVSQTCHCRPCVFSMTSWHIQWKRFPYNVKHCWPIVKYLLLFPRFCLFYSKIFGCRCCGLFLPGARKNQLFRNLHKWFISCVTYCSACFSQGGVQRRVACCESWPDVDWGHNHVAVIVKLFH
jgi:hypothetical protein